MVGRDLISFLNHKFITTEYEYFLQVFLILPNLHRDYYLSWDGGLGGKYCHLVTFQNGKSNFHVSVEKFAVVTMSSFISYTMNSSSHSGSLSDTGIHLSTLCIDEMDSSSSS